MVPPAPAQRRGVQARVTEAAAFAVSAATIALLTLLYVRWLHLSHPTIVALSFLVVVLVVATVSTLRVAVATSALSFLFFNYFFLPPVGTWTIADPENWVALFTLLAVSIIASHLSTQARRRAQEATARRDELARLFDLTRDILLTTDTADAVALLAGDIARRFGFARVAICLPGADGWHLHRAGEPRLELDGARLDAALAAARGGTGFEANRGAARRHGRICAADGSAVWLVPLRVGTRPIGIVALQGDHVEPGTCDAIAGITAIAIERAHLLEERKEAEVVRRGAELKSALLAALSHDLKTPLTAVTVAANNLHAASLTEEQRREQAEIVRAELDRLNRLFDNIVEMARIEANAVSAEPEWVSPAEIVEAAACQVEHALSRHRVTVDLPAEQTLVRLDPRLTSAALAHILENAAQYSPTGSSITVGGDLGGDEFRVFVRDEGPGIAPHDLERLFERFYRGAAAREHRFGTGMGLAIARGLLAAQGGRIWAANHERGGAVFTIAVPAESRRAEALDGEAV